MRKLIKEFEINHLFDWQYGKPIDEIRADLDAMQAKGANMVNIDHYEEYGCTYLSFKAVDKREETDKEFEERVFEENQKRDRIKRRDLKLLEELKQKYESK